MRLLVALLMLAGVAFGQEADVRAAEQTWSKAILTKDIPALQKLLGDQLIYAHSTGIVYLGTGPQATGTVITPGPAVTVPGPTVTVNPSGGVAPPLPDGVTVRRSTGTSTIHRRLASSADVMGAAG